VCWDWIGEQRGRHGVPLKVLNLFAYSGGSTLAAAATGAEVVHVDSARSMVHRARENASASGLADATIRWIVDDARRFAERELRRGRAYDALILDPPTYGHGPHGQSWKLADDLEPLLEVCRALTAGRLAFAILTCHTPGFGPEMLRKLLRKCLLGATDQEVQADELSLVSADGRKLPSGAYARLANAYRVGGRHGDNPTPGD
jgi:23S rRNA (cytosine1962-C5)-methyltransferase